MQQVAEGNLLRDALESLPEPVLLWTEEGRVAFASQPFLETFGVRRADVEGADDPTLLRALERQGVAVSRASPASVRMAARGRTFECVSRPLPNGGRLDLFREVTEHQRDLERQEELWGVATHDLRGPLANVRSYAGLLLGGRAAPNLDPKVRRSAEVIARNADKALRLLQAYFDSLRAETGFLDLDLQPAPLGPLLEELVRSRQAGAAEKGVAIALRVDPSLPPVRLDRERMANALGALLDNAIAREPSPGEVEVSAELSRGAVRVQFADHGSALDAEQAREVFDRDAQILRERRLGLGFAVAVARAIAEAHDGHAGVESSRSRTVFFAAMPPASGAGERH